MHATFSAPPANHTYKEAAREDKVPINIGITGKQGVGKSSLINALRGLSDFDEGAAEIDAMQVTQGYPHPVFPNVTLWELPGTEMLDFSAEKYLQSIHYSRYDFFILVASELSTIGHLAHAIQRMGKQFYCVHSKMDVCIKKKKIKQYLNEEVTLQNIREDCRYFLQIAGISSPEIFLISSWYWEKYDFPILQKTLENKIGLLKRLATNAKKEKEQRSTATSGNTGISAFFSRFYFRTDGVTQRSHEEVADKTLQELDTLENTKLNIAVTGVTGAGKSSLVNALRGIADNEEGAAKTGVVQTTMDVHKYPHPLFPNVIIWDLPGFGTPEFTPEEYLKKVSLNRYDFFIIVSSDRFTNNDVLLTKEIRKMQKKYYYVYSKMDVLMDSERWKPNFSEHKTLEKIKNYCCDSLRMAGEPSPRVFLISSKLLNMYDFPLLQDTLEMELDGLKRHALILALPVFSRGILEKKKAAMEAHIWKVALVSCFIGAIPVPGLSFACDLSILVTALLLFYKVFGLNEDSLRRAEKQVGKDYRVLKSAIKKSPMSSEITPEFVVGLLSRSLVCGSLIVLETVFGFVPGLGSLVGGASSFGITYYMLNNFLKDIVEDAENVRAVAAEP